MSLAPGPSNPDRPGELRTTSSTGTTPSTTRRTLLRTGSHAAWAAPAVALASAAPAFAGSNDQDLRIDSALWWRDESQVPYNGWHMVVPSILVTNTTKYAVGSVQITVDFPTATFTGTDDWGQGVPKTPATVNTKSLTPPGWGPSTHVNGPKPYARVYLSLPGLAGRKTAWVNQVGGFGTAYFGWAFTSISPSVTSIGFTLTGTGVSLAGSMTNTAAPS